LPEVVALMSALGLSLKGRSGWPLLQVLINQVWQQRKRRWRANKETKRAKTEGKVGLRKKSVKNHNVPSPNQRKRSRTRYVDLGEKILEPNNGCYCASTVEDQGWVSLFTMI
jgi:hypothetical protein